VHADASNFANGVTKEEAYEQVLLQAEGLFDGQRNWPSLILGPFMGKVACQTIPFGRGVCGAAAATRETQLVPDVDAFPGHIACDGDSKSEVVVPVVAEGGKLVAIIDVDCTVTEGFDEVDRVWLEKLAALLAKSCDW
ncbi:gaf protein, partial [Colletotrichum incanum]